MSKISQLSYYEQNKLNPGQIPLDSEADWVSHTRKRDNLYTRHLALPLPLFRGRSVLEFGCNTGDNALVLAEHGARLSLVEPNSAIAAQIPAHFERRGLQRAIETVSTESLQHFSIDRKFDFVIAEGFLYTLPDRREMLLKICALLEIGGFGIISFNDRFGVLIEFIRKLIFVRSCAQEGIADQLSDAALAIARQCFHADFSRLNASRPFEVWARDVLASPLIDDYALWTYQELLPILDEAGCEVHATSPAWFLADHFQWYKNVPSCAERHAGILDGWRRCFSWFLTGRRAGEPLGERVPDAVTSASSELITAISSYMRNPTPACAIEYPPALSAFLCADGEGAFDADLKALFAALSGDASSRVQSAYQAAVRFRELWGTPYHYLSFRRREPAR